MAKLVLSQTNPFWRLLSRPGFPLFEIILTFLIVSSFWIFHIGKLFRTREGTDAQITQKRMLMLEMAIQSYRWTNNTYPPHLGALACQGEDRRACIPVATPELLVDAWQMSFEYEGFRSSYTIASLGADRRPGGRGPDADIRMRGS